MSTIPRLQLAILGKMTDVIDAYAISIATAQTRVLQRKGRQIHTGPSGLRTQVQNRLGGSTGKAIRLGQPRKIMLDPKITEYSKLGRKLPDGRWIDIVDVFSASRRIQGKGMLYIPTPAAAQRAGERFRRQVSPEDFKGQMIFLPSNSSAGRGRRGRRSTRGVEGVLVSKERPRVVLFVVRRQVRLKRRFQPFAARAARLFANTAELIAKELERQLVRRLRRLR